MHAPNSAISNSSSKGSTNNQAGGTVPSLPGCPGRVRRVKVKPLRGRYANLDTSPTA